MQISFHLPRRTPNLTRLGGNSMPTSWMFFRRRQVAWRGHFLWDTPLIASTPTESVPYSHLPGLSPSIPTIPMRSHKQGYQLRRLSESDVPRHSHFHLPSPFRFFCNSSYKLPHLPPKTFWTFPESSPYSRLVRSWWIFMKEMKRVFLCEINKV